MLVGPGKSRRSGSTLVKMHVPKNLDVPKIGRPGKIWTSRFFGRLGKSGRPEKTRTRAGRGQRRFCLGNRTVARAWRRRGAGYRLQFGMSGAGVARAWRGHFLFPLDPAGAGANRGSVLADYGVRAAFGRHGRGRALGTQGVPLMRFMFCFALGSCPVFSSHGCIYGTAAPLFQWCGAAGAAHRQHH
eukprot:gene23654-biopygen16368